MAGDDDSLDILFGTLTPVVALLSYIHLFKINDKNISITSLLRIVHHRNVYFQLLFW